MFHLCTSWYVTVFVQIYIEANSSVYYLSSAYGGLHKNYQPLCALDVIFRKSDSIKYYYYNQR